MSAAARRVVEQLRQERPRAEQPDQHVRDQHAGRAAGERRRQPLEQELQQDRAAPRAERLAQADLARPLGDRHEHDVHHADAADGQRQHADERQHELQAEHDAGR